MRSSRPACLNRYLSRSRTSAGKRSLAPKRYESCTEDSKRSVNFIKTRIPFSKSRSGCCTGALDPSQHPADPQVVPCLRELCACLRERVIDILLCMCVCWNLPVLLILGTRQRAFKGRV